MSFTAFSFSLFELSDFTQADVRSENRQLQARLKSVVSLERMKEALEKKDQEQIGRASCRERV